MGPGGILRVAIHAEPSADPWRGVPWKLWPSHEPRVMQHHGRDLVAGIGGRPDPCANVTPRLQSDGDDAEVRRHLGYRRRRRTAHWRQAGPVRDAQGWYVHLRFGDQLRGRKADPMVR